MNILVACEYSGTVRDAFIAKGHNAISCDILPSDRPGPHYKGDVRDILWGKFDAWQWDLMIAFPPCTYLAISGRAHWHNRQQEQLWALDFVRILMSAPIPKIAIENPVGKISTAIRKPDQYVQPYMFGEPQSKKTGLWLKNLPKLVETNNVYDEMMALPYKERCKIHWMGPSKDRSKIRSKTFQGIANAMAEQWG